MSVNKDLQNQKPKLAFMINLIAPYRVPILARLAECFELFILHGQMESNRAWDQGVVAGAHERPVWGWQYAYKVRKSGQLFDQRFFHFEPGYLIELLRIRPDAVITIELGFRTILAIIYGFLFRVPVWVSWEGSLHTEGGLDRPRRLFRRLIAGTIKHWISWGQTSTEYLISLNVSRGRILQIQNCVDESWYVKPVAPAISVFPKPVILHVGQIIARKGVAELVRAAAALQSEGANFSLVFVGDGPDLVGLKALAAQLDVKNLHFYPVQAAEAMPAFYRSADVLVFPTMHDVWGLVANEAVLSGLIVLCSKHAGCAKELFSAECIFEPASPEEFLTAFRKAVAGKLPSSDSGKIKTIREVAEMIIAEVKAALLNAKQAE
jgi:glycosyltransferase involved in cell wall biosynthesis